MLFGYNANMTGDTNFLSTACGTYWYIM